MMKKSAGILAYRFRREMQFFLVHPGGPFFKNKDAGVWSIPKGLYEEDEDPLAAALREFFEETGYVVKGKFIPLSPVKQKGGKVVIAWAIEQEVDETSIVSNTFEMLWPPRFGEMQRFPEVDRADWFTLDEASHKMIGAQVALLHELIETIK